jgi:DNA-binding PadR family transcriptional regulator
MSTSTLNTTLTSQAFYVLLALTDKTLHGYAIRKQVAYDSESSLIMAPGTTYDVLKRLSKARLIEAVEAPDATNSNITCRYRLTNRGRLALASELDRLERTLGRAKYKLNGKLW